MDDLRAELEYFERNRGEWLAHHEGKYALIKGQSVLGFYDSTESAYAAGINQLGNVPFLVKQVRRHDQIEQAPALVYGLLHADF